MGAVMEALFCICYLAGVCVMGCVMLTQSKNNKERGMFGALTLVLVGGDAFHLVPRIYGLFTGKVKEIPAALGLGTLVASVTMTVFYVMLYRFWLRRNERQKTGALTAMIYILAALRILACFHPANDWFSADSPLMWGVIRNIPFAFIGALIVWCFFQTRKNDKPFRFAYLAVLLSFLFYFPVVLFAGAIPAFGAFMLPKTVCYVWLIFMGYKGV